MRHVMNSWKTLTLGVVIAALHYVVTFTSIYGIALSAIAPAPHARIAPDTLARVFAVCTFPISLLPVGSEPWLMLMLNSALWGLSLAALVRLLWSRRKRTARRLSSR